MRITLRRAVKSDIEQIVPMVEKFFENSELYSAVEFDYESTAEFLANLIDSSDGEVLVATAADTIVGTASFMCVPALVNKAKKIFQGVHLYVAPGFRKYGIGRNLYDRAEALGRAMGSVVCVVETPTKDCEAIEALHESNGYNLFQKQFYKVVN